MVKILDEYVAAIILVLLKGMSSLHSAANKFLSIAPTGIRYSRTLACSLGLRVMAFYGSYFRNCSDFHISRLLLLLCQKVGPQSIIFFAKFTCIAIIFPQMYILFHSTLTYYGCFCLAVFLEGS